MKSFDVIVLGGGINGLATAYHLLRRGVKNLGLLEQFELGHGRGSSHGKSRITRSSYSSAKYVKLIQVAHQQEWPRLSHDSGKRLLLPTPGCFYGPGVEQYLESMKAVPEVEDMYRVLRPEQARATFPMFRFPDSPLVIEDRTGSVVAAEETMTFLAHKVKAGATVVEGCPVESVTRNPESIVLSSPLGQFECGKLVVTAGAWLGRLLPDFAPRLMVAHQDVGYFQIEGSQQFPVWVYCAGQGDSYYGLPSFGRPGAKVARHRTGNEGDDPDRVIHTEMSSKARVELREFLAAQFSGEAELIGYEACLYTNTVNEDFILDHHPEDSRIVVGSACSGHGFKFGPLTGRLLADLVLDGKTGIPLFEEYRDAFRLKAHGAWAR